MLVYYLVVVVHFYRSSTTSLYGLSVAALSAMFQGSLSPLTLTRLHTFLESERDCSFEIRASKRLQ